MWIGRYIHVDVEVDVYSPRRRFAAVARSRPAQAHPASPLGSHSVSTNELAPIRNKKDQRRVHPNTRASVHIVRCVLVVES